MFYRFAGVIIATFMAQASLAAECAPTPRVPTRNYPGAAQIPFGNNLLQPAGKAVASDGQKLTIHGQLVDNQCVPIAGAVVELWQANPYGRYGIATPAERVTAGPTFVGAGRATTDNNGNFYFITAFPAPVGKLAPSVNVKIMGERLSDFSTALYFGDDWRNSGDEVLSKTKIDRNRVTIVIQPGDGDGLNGSIRLVLPQRAPYRTF